MTKPSFNEYASQYYHQLISATDGGADRAEAMAEASAQAALAVDAKLCYPPEATQAARAAINEYDDKQGRAADKILAALATGAVDQPTGYRSAEIKRTIAVLGKGRRQLIGSLTAQDLEYMVENRTVNHAKAGIALVTFTENVGTVSPTIAEHGTIGAALDAGEFRTNSAESRDNERKFNLPDATGKRVIPRKSRKKN